MKAYRKDYPRPQLVRDGWMDLNGTWDFCFDDEKRGEREKWQEAFPSDARKIEVPFTYETARSGIGDPSHHETVWYHRTLLKSGSGKHTILHLEGSDFETDVWVNGEHAGNHRGGYARFSFDITAFLHEGENDLTIRVKDPLSIEQPRGKQRWAPVSYACWYVQTTGLWKSVWTEEVPETYVEALKITPDFTGGAVRLEIRTGGELPGAAGKELEVETEISFSGTRIAKSRKQVLRSLTTDDISVFSPEESPFGIHPWTPADPALYDVTIRLLADGEPVDEVYSYFGLREVSIDKGTILLNGEPLYQRLILDQGYWKDSGLTAPDEQALIDDIDKIQAMGFNGVRKHMKVEDERFLYWCDVKGLLVWSEMAAAYEFSDRAVAEFTREWLEVVQQNYSHPSIITWTPFNESWGVPRIKTEKMQQHFTQAVYYLTRSIDSMRPIITNDGWEHTISDVVTLHDYEEDGDVFLARYDGNREEIGTGHIYHNRFKAAMADGYPYTGQPVIVSEFGGIAFSGGETGAWGYGNTVDTEEAFLERFDRIITAIKKVPYISGYCYTQVSDVQQEINGLLTEDHEYKVTPEKLKEINCRVVRVW